MRSYVRLFAVLFALPLVCLAFFSLAPKWYESRLHTRLTKLLEAEPDYESKAEHIELLERIDFRDLCQSGSVDAQQFLSFFNFKPVCRDFEIFGWAKILAALTFLVSAAYCLLLLRKSNKGKRSSSVILFVSLLCQSVLAVALCFYATVLPTGKYYPELLVALGLIALYTFYKTYKTLTQ